MSSSPWPPGVVRLVAYGLFVVAVGGAGVMWYIDLSQLTALRSEGKVAKGVVESKQTGRSFTHYVTYTFDAGGRQGPYTDKVSLEYYDWAKEGSPIEVVYLPGNPGVHALGKVGAEWIESSTRFWFWNMVKSVLGTGLFVVLAELALWKRRRG